MNVRDVYDNRKIYSMEDDKFIAFHVLALETVKRNLTSDITRLENNLGLLRQISTNMKLVVKEEG